MESLLTTGSCEDIVIDIPTGTGFVSMADSTGIGFLAKYVLAPKLLLTMLGST